MIPWKLRQLEFFLVYDKSSYWLYYPILGMMMFLTRFSQKWKVHLNNFFGVWYVKLLAILPYFRYENVFDKVLPDMVSMCPHRINFFLCFELEQIRDHIYYTNATHLYSKCGRRFALAQSITKIILLWHFSCAIFNFWEKLVKNIFIPKIG